MVWPIYQRSWREDCIEARPNKYKDTDIKQTLLYTTQTTNTCPRLQLDTRCALIVSIVFFSLTFHNHIEVCEFIIHDV